MNVRTFVGRNMPCNLGWLWLSYLAYYLAYRPWLRNILYNTIQYSFISPSIYAVKRNNIVEYISVYNIRQ